MADQTPTNEASRRSIKGHVTRWITNIHNYENATMDRTVCNLIEGAESNLKNMYNKFVKLSSGVTHDLELAGATQKQFDDESDYQIEIQESVGQALQLAKRKKEEFKEILAQEERKAERILAQEERKEERKQQEQTFLLMFDTQQRAADAAKAQEKLDRQQEIQNQRDLFQQLIAAIPTAAAPGAGNPAPVPAASTKLPKRQIKPFKGDVLEWTSFWEGYNAAVHESTIPAVQKFGYLKDYLKGEAQLCVENLELTDANYTVAVNLLKAMYGKPDVLIEAHTHKLDTLQPVKDMADTAALRYFQLTIQSHINALETIGVARTSHGGLLGSRILRSIPLKLQAEWTKTATNKVTDIDQVLKFIEEQVEAAERLNRLRAQTPKPVQNSQQPAKAAPTTTPTASQLGVSSKPTPNSKSPGRPRRNGSPPRGEKQHHLRESQHCPVCFARKCTGLQTAQWS